MNLKGFVLSMQSSLLGEYLKEKSHGHISIKRRKELAGFYTKVLPKLSFSYSINEDLESLIN